ncbi:hypothetical protein Acr_00g0014360 [Actinidia rufa]|uniref:Uncharacterized protein n=1 Tax=Actinidia rufa TaxID=165716 RepID=A0A7J0DAA5_9ERIC|nr:hypothetical protein Acr_00g0014360 [Actinidia rufa]
MTIEVTQYPSSPREDSSDNEGSPSVDTQPLPNRETNIMTQGELDRLRESRSFPAKNQIRLSEADETIARIMVYYNICPAQLTPNAWQSVVSTVVLWQFNKFALTLNEFRNLFSLFNNPKPDFRWLYFKVRLKQPCSGGIPTMLRDGRRNSSSSEEITRSSPMDYPGSLKFRWSRGRGTPQSFLRNLGFDSGRMAFSGGDNAKEKPLGDAAHVVADKAMLKKVDMKKFAQMAKGRSESKGVTSVTKGIAIGEKRPGLS